MQNETPPDAVQIVRRFASPPVRATRPIVLAGIEMLKFARRFGWEPDVDVSLDDLDAPAIFAANHESHADTAAILGTLPPRLRRHTAVAAAMDVFGGGPTARLRSRFLQHIVASGFRAFAFDRHGPPMRSLRTAIALVRQNWNILLYPEGTRSRTGELGTFKLGVGVLARRTGRPVVPIFVCGGREVLPCGTFMPRRGRIIVRYGPPLRYEEGETARAFTQRLHRAVCALGAQQKGARHRDSDRANGIVLHQVDTNGHIENDASSVGWPRHSS